MRRLEKMSRMWRRKMTEQVAEEQAGAEKEKK